MGLGVIYYFISFQQTIGTNSSFSEGASEEDESIATLDEAVMEVHAKQTRGNGWVGIEICKCLFHNGFDFRASIGIEPYPLIREFITINFISIFKFL